MYHKIYNPVHNKYYDIWNKNGIETIYNYINQSNYKIGGSTILKKNLKSKDLIEIIEDCSRKNNFDDIHTKLTLIDKENIEEFSIKHTKNQNELNKLCNQLLKKGISDEIIQIINPNNKSILKKKPSTKKSQTAKSSSIPIPKYVSAQENASAVSRSLYNYYLSQYSQNEIVEKKLINMELNYTDNRSKEFEKKDQTEIWNKSFINSKPEMPFKSVETAGDGNCGYHSIIQSLIESFYILGEGSSEILKKFIHHLVILEHNPSEIALNNLIKETIKIPREIINYFRIFILQQTDKSDKKFLPDDEDNRETMKKIKGGIKSEQTTFIPSNFWLDEHVLVSIVRMFDVPVLAYLKKEQPGWDKVRKKNINENKFFITGEKGDSADCKFGQSEQSSKKDCNHIIFMFNNEYHFTYLTTTLNDYYEKIKKILQEEKDTNSIYIKYKELKEQEAEETEAKQIALRLKDKAYTEWQTLLDTKIKTEIDKYLDENYKFKNLYSVSEDKKDIEKKKTKKKLVRIMSSFNYEYNKSLESIKTNDPQDGMPPVEKAQYYGEQAEKTIITKFDKKLEPLIKEKLNTFVETLNKEAKSKFLVELIDSIKTNFSAKLKELKQSNLNTYVEDYINQQFDHTYLEEKFGSVKVYTQESLKRLKEEISQREIPPIMEKFLDEAQAQAEAEAQAQAKAKAQAEAQAKAQAEAQAKAEALLIAKSNIKIKIIEKFQDYLKREKMELYENHVNSFVNDVLIDQITIDIDSTELEKYEPPDDIIEIYIRDLIKFGNREMMRSSPQNSGSDDMYKRLSNGVLSTKIKGLFNPSNICYFNAMLSSLFHLPIIRNMDIGQFNLNDETNEFYKQFYTEFISLKNEYIKDEGPNPINTSHNLVDLAFKCLGVLDVETKNFAEQNAKRRTFLRSLPSPNPEETEELRGLMADQVRDDPAELQRKINMRGLFKAIPPGSTKYTQEDTNEAFLHLLKFTDSKETSGLVPFFRFTTQETRVCLDNRQESVTERPPFVEDVHITKINPDTSEYYHINQDYLCNFEETSAPDWRYQGDEGPSCDSKIKINFIEWPQI